MSIQGKPVTLIDKISRCSLLTVSARYLVLSTREIFQCVVMETYQLQSECYNVGAATSVVGSGRRYRDGRYSTPCRHCVSLQREPGVWGNRVDALPRAVSRMDVQLREECSVMVSLYCCCCFVLIGST
ncbi:hypothetical protein, unlikely [Trypanosoma brucei gambiense DAL972]|uniref:Uncharacterized protein n=1 Tax=Trypanosoma brucei gambiense (strain MHOM/CI/86/DAL972) TaxID=679716 RepID=C9ZU31_TRYB9|nr:hypothetical protein, unlikely [Trypanosoma brucei gambiense DAL972]CBH12917.1 hypothetical protein, unlikely [Trypanosoma brucei gambiense DAL972]|eukprot:XP_011775196.1 hypothetical protein, unlikely [Trypanosoma brucei gambiense DAL972]